MSGELAHLSLLELLDHDARPAFVLDLHELRPKVDLNSRIVYTNVALQASPITIACLPEKYSEARPHDATALARQRWHDWLIDVKDLAATTRKFSPFIYEHFTWTACTIQKRWRVVSGVPCHISAEDNPPLFDPGSGIHTPLPEDDAPSASTGPPLGLIPDRLVLPSITHRVDFSSMSSVNSRPSHNTSATEVSERSHDTSIEFSLPIRDHDFISFWHEAHRALQSCEKAIRRLSIYPGIESKVFTCALQTDTDFAELLGKAEHNKQVFRVSPPHDSRLNVEYRFAFSSGKEPFGYLTVLENGVESSTEMVQDLMAALEASVKQGQQLDSKPEVSRQRTSGEFDIMFKALADLNPLAMFYFGPEGEMSGSFRLDPMLKQVYINESWWRLCAYPGMSMADMSFLDVVVEDDRERAGKEWLELTLNKKNRVFEIRLRNTWFHTASQKHKPIPVLASIVPDIANGKLRGVIGTCTDITLQKQAEEDALERAALSDLLVRRTRQVAESENKLRQLSEISPSEGIVIWANDAFYTMSGHGRSSSDHVPRSLDAVVDERDREALVRGHNEVLFNKQSVKFEIRFRQPWMNEVNGHSTAETRWALVQATAELSDDGSVKNIVGALADISALKYAESLQIRSRIEAEDARKALEQFIDITSHEMRNPLTAILQSADAITGIVGGLTDRTPYAAEFASIMDSAEIVTLCAQHQGRIINDTLTLSKLDAGMLTVSPMPVQPLSPLKQTIRMFEGEASSHATSLGMVIEPSYTACRVDWVLADSARFGQVLINLVTNAIKFTKGQSVRNVTLSISASCTRPACKEAYGVEWFPSRRGSVRVVDHDLPGTPADDLYIIFAVRDTGRGLSVEEKSRLFNRFAQANPRTHVEYGGSGLGLFISRELAELHGGEIGLSSTPNQGSTFAFYIKACRTHPPLKRSHDSSDGDSRTNSPSAKSADTASSRPTGSINLLLVEDNLINQKVLSKQLQNAGCMVAVANHGEEALAYLRKTNTWSANRDQGHDLSIILMDLEMPVLNGRDCLRRIRQAQRLHELSHHIPIIAVTANARQEQIQACLADGFDSVMPKPFRVPELLREMRVLLQKPRDLPPHNRSHPTSGVLRQD